MDVQKKDISSTGIKLFIIDGEKEIARAHLYLMNNDLHDKPFGLMEDVFVSDEKRGQGLGTKIVEALIKEAKNQGCYKLICTSRYSNEKVHELYKKLGFKDWGKEFRMNFD